MQRIVQLTPSCFLRASVAGPPAVHRFRKGAQARHETPPSMRRMPFAPNRARQSNKVILRDRAPWLRCMRTSARNIAWSYF
jgi:hypothetical protein